MYPPLQEITNNNAIPRIEIDATYKDVKGDEVVVSIISLLNSHLWIYRNQWDLGRCQVQLNSSCSFVIGIPDMTCLSEQMKSALDPWCVVIDLKKTFFALGGWGCSDVAAASGTDKSPTQFLSCSSPQGDLKCLDNSRISHRPLSLLWWQLHVDDTWLSESDKAFKDFCEVCEWAVHLPKT